MSNNAVPNAKQVVFLFMAATVVAVVVFLCGVLVGRGVPIGGGLTARSISVESLSADLPPATLSSPRSEPSAAASESAELTYYRRLDGGDTQPDVLRPASTGDAQNTAASLVAGVADEHKAHRDNPEPREPEVVREALAAPDTDADRPVSGPALPPSEPAGRMTDGFSVQVGALRSEAPALEMARQLTRKGYPARVVPPEADARVAWFRIRVGPYADRAEAQRVMRRLETEEQFYAFVTR